VAEKTSDTPPAGKRTSISVTVALAGQIEGQQLPSARVYLFDRAGRLVESKPVDKETVRFKVDPLTDYRVTVGPDLLQSKEPPPNLVSELAKATAPSQDFLHETDQESVVLKINPNIWICWFPTCVNIHGTVRKLLNPGGTPAQYAPICTGTVQIFQVDLGCTLDSFTVFDFVRLKAKLIDTLTLSAGAHTTETLSKPLPPGPPPELRLGGAATLLSAKSASSLSEIATTLPVLNDSTLKHYLVSEKATLWPFLCTLIPDSAFCWQELTEVAIQSDGTFSAEVCFWCPADYPDLYFEVVQNVDGSETEIYDPQIACSTYYNYDGSQSVDITIEDPRAVACQPTGGTGPAYLYVWPTAIGNIDLKYINGLETGSGTGLVPQQNSWGFTEDGAWGGTLPLQMQFHPDLQANNIKYYRWSYQFDGDVEPTQIKATVTHRYQTLTISGMIITIHLIPVTLGPLLISGPTNPGGTSNLFAIPDPTLPWIDINDPLDRPFAYFDSTGGLTPGKSGMCTLILELFDGDGNFVPANNTLGLSALGDQPGDPAPPGLFTYILPDIGGPPDTYTNAPTPNITDHGRLIFRVRVDNAMTDAELPGAETPLGEADPCGLSHYTKPSDLISVDYVAYQPSNFIDWALTVSRGFSGVVASLVPPAPATTTSAGSPGADIDFTNPASTLLGGCTQAAFAVNLYCAARITNGYERQSQYDTWAASAFALMNP
jgi:hypothetical protein